MRLKDCFRVEIARRCWNFEGKKMYWSRSILLHSYFPSISFRLRHCQLIQKVPKGAPWTVIRVANLFSSIISGKQPWGSSQTVYGVTFGEI